MMKHFIGRLMLVCVVIASALNWDAPGVPAVNAASEVGPIRFEVETDVSPTDAIFVEEAIRFAEQAFDTRFGPRTFELDVIVRSGQSSFGPGNYGIYDPGVIQIFTGSAAWSTRLDIERLKGVVHEYAHAYLDPAPNPRRRSLWLEEGLSEFLAWSVLSDTGLIDHAAILAYHAAVVRLVPPGERLCEISASSLSGFDYPFVHLGAALVTGPKGTPAIGYYRDAMTGGTSHPEAFEAAFGQTEAEFCANSTDAILTLSPSASVPSDLFRGTSEDGDTAVDFTSVPAFTLPGQQLLIEAESSAFAECLLETFSEKQAENPLPRPSIANSEGDVFWLTTVPTDPSAGNLTLSITCGSNRTTVTIQIRT